MDGGWVTFLTTECQRKSRSQRGPGATEIGTVTVTVTETRLFFLVVFFDRDQLPRGTPPPRLVGQGIKYTRLCNKEMQPSFDQIVPITDNCAQVFFISGYSGKYRNCGMLLISYGAR